jgi:hypothetical protein
MEDVCFQAGLVEGEVFIAPVRRLWSEIRLWVIHDQIVTGSQYEPEFYPIDSSHAGWQKAKHYLDTTQKFRTESEAFVMDIGQTEQGWKIVELNCANASGLYECDARAVAAAFSLVPT